MFRTPTCNPYRYIFRRWAINSACTNSSLNALVRHKFLPPAACRVQKSQNSAIFKTNMGKTYVVEHLDPELGPWSALEYQTIAQECCEAGSQLYLCGIAGHLEIPPDLRQSKGLHIDQRASEIVFANNKTRTCLLDPAAEQELDPEDGSAFDVFLFGGILGDDPPRGKCY